MISTSLADATEARLNELIGASESLTLEFKRDLPGRDDQAKVELLKDVSAIANAAGGDIAYGIDETNGTAAAIAPITAEPFEVAERRMRQVLDAIEPRLDTLQFKEVPLGTGGYAMVLRVPQSYLGPHRYSFKGQHRFVQRDGTRTQDMTYDQLRAAFDRTASLTERARGFRQDRLTAVSNGSWREMEPVPVCIVHAIPISAMTGRQAVDVAAAYNDFTGMMFSHWGGASRSLNLDGLTSYSTSRQKLSDFTILFRTGALEMASTAGSEYENQKWLASTAIANFVREAIQMSNATFRRFGVSGPAIIGGALLRASGYNFGVSQHRRMSHGAPSADRDNFVLPETWVEDVASFPGIDSVARPMLDILWQGFNFTRCFDYDDTGNWSPER